MITSKNGMATVRSNNSRNFGCSPSPRESANAFKLFVEVMSVLLCFFGQDAGP